MSLFNKKGERRKMKNKLVSILMVLTLISSMLMVTVPITPISASPEPDIIEVSIPMQITTDPHYDRNPSVFRANGRYWLFFVKATSDPPHIPPTYNPDTDSYDVYYATSSDSGTTWSAETKLTK